MAPLTSYTCKLDDGQSKALHAFLREQGYEFREVPYARFAAAKDKTTVVYYESGKLVIQGKGTSEFVEFVLEPQILQEARVGYEEVHDPTIFDPRIGVDESGKGDYFGPLCVAGVYVNRMVLESWKSSGIRDSKAIGSDRRIAELAKVIRQTPGCFYTVVPIGNPAYNKLMLTMRSVNNVLAWGHARIIENMMELGDKLQPAPLRAISDQFARTKDVVEKRLMALGRALPLVQRHKAESDLAVAAASILARDEFVRRLGEMGKRYGVHLPKGASAAVIQAGKDFVARNGSEKLGEVAKLHFKTTHQVLGTIPPSCPDSSSIPL